ncbi:kinase-like domain-containing protein [Kickxella alabastrina]|uniref:kinase-like domain-containing protein n=1 Tax=Kickxella alabastrina TaxID=61397 RepID=UPI002220BCE2|nr:kinase-like domain-containing protein [Kickxella alabastrina]KAI7826642.1 kinase-like domain-containing protein [Kickxella alabastrina]
MQQHYSQTSSKRHRDSAFRSQSKESMYPGCWEGTIMKTIYSPIGIPVVLPAVKRLRVPTPCPNVKQDNQIIAIEEKESNGCLQPTNSTECSAVESNPVVDGKDVTAEPPLIIENAQPKHEDQQDTGLADSSSVVGDSTENQSPICDISDSEDDQCTVVTQTQKLEEYDDNVNNDDDAIKHATDHVGHEEHNQQEDGGHSNGDRYGNNDDNNSTYETEQEHDHDHDHNHGASDTNENNHGYESEAEGYDERYEDENNGGGEEEEDIADGTLEEIEELEKLIPGLSSQYRLLGKIGEGTFSTVYKAIDLQHDRYDNSSWTMIFDSEDSNFGENAADDNDYGQILRARRKSNQQQQQQQRRARVVAIKKIYVTSSPARIANEISILNDLRGSKFIAPLVTAMRKEDQVVVVLPYFPNDDFRRFYLEMPLEEMRWYFASLLSALAFAHSKGIMHRDIKPSNFLYDVRRRHGVLVDFGLAERENDQEAVRYRSRHALQMDTSTASRMFCSIDQKGRPGIPRRDTRPGLRANRAGTRGFRAPEVLLKIPEQSVLIDIWSVGVILLCFLTRRFPFFQSTDDTEALLEIAVLYGRLEMERAAVALGRTFLTNIPTVKDRGIRFESLAKAYNAEGFPYLPPEVFDLLRKMLALNPGSR